MGSLPFSSPDAPEKKKERDPRCDGDGSDGGSGGSLLGRGRRFSNEYPVRFQVHRIVEKSNSMFIYYSQVSQPQFPS